MKHLLQLIFIVLLITSCNTNSTREIKLDAETRRELRDLVKELHSANKNGWTQDTMVPIVLLEKQNKNLYEKYGLDVGGNCYACDLAQIAFNSKRITFLNVCDGSEKESQDVKFLSSNKQLITITGTNCNFTFTKIEDGPVYEFAMTFKAVNNQQLRISKYYTTVSELPKFKVRDCGDFGG